jgi:predicted AlkP superfamily pyrophosphatase or phosphodiesterase
MVVRGRPSLQSAEVRMKRLIAALFALITLAIALPSAQPAPGPDTRLVLLIAVDQFRYDYLTRFRSEYTDGIKRLLTDGAVFTNANLEHYPTVTAIGHATMLTGATPSVSGIIGNDWFDRDTGATVMSVSDPTVRPLGSTTGSAASPRRLPAERGAALYDAIYGSPYGNDLLVEFASELLRRERLGTRNATDLLSVSFSSNDSVGHTYGPDSPQVRDIAVRTDRAIGRLLNEVDKMIGLGHTLVAFTADHGVARLPEVLRDSGLPGGRFTSQDLFDPIQRALATRLATADGSCRLPDRRPI